MDSFSVSSDWLTEDNKNKNLLSRLASCDGVFELLLKRLEFVSLMFSLSAFDPVLDLSGRSDNLKYVLLKIFLIKFSLKK